MAGLSSRLLRSSTSAITRRHTWTVSLQRNSENAGLRISPASQWYSLTEGSAAGRVVIKVYRRAPDFLWTSLCGITMALVAPMSRCLAGFVFSGRVKDAIAKTAEVMGLQPRGSCGTSEGAGTHRGAKSAESVGRNFLSLARVAERRWRTAKEEIRVFFFSGLEWWAKALLLFERESGVASATLFLWSRGSAGYDSQMSRRTDRRFSRLRPDRPELACGSSPAEIGRADPC